MATTHANALGLEEDDHGLASIRWATVERAEQPGREGLAIAYPPMNNDAVFAVWQMANWDESGPSTSPWPAVKIAELNGNRHLMLAALSKATDEDQERICIEEIVLAMDITSDHVLLARIDGDDLRRHKGITRDVKKIATATDPERTNPEDVERAVAGLCEELIGDEVNEAALKLAGTIEWGTAGGYVQKGLIVVDKEGRAINEKNRGRARTGPAVDGENRRRGSGDGQGPDPALAGRRPGRGKGTGAGDGRRSVKRDRARRAGPGGGSGKRASITAGRAAKRGSNRGVQGTVVGGLGEHLEHVRTAQGGRNEGGGTRRTGPQKGGPSRGENAGSGGETRGPGRAIKVVAKVR